MNCLFCEKELLFKDDKSKDQCSNCGCINKPSKNYYYWSNDKYYLYLMPTLLEYQMTIYNRFKNKYLVEDYVCSQYFFKKSTPERLINKMLKLMNYY